MRSVIFLLIIILLGSVLTFSCNNQTAWAYLNSIVRVIPTSIELGPQNVIGQFLTIAVVVEDVAGLQGVSIEFAWNTSYLNYVGHTMTMPVDTYNTPQPPSPYAGLLNGPYIMLTDVPDILNGVYEVAIETDGSPFIGSGTVFVMTFQVAYQPQPGEADVTLSWQFLSVSLANFQGDPIPYEIEDCNITIYSRWNYADIDSNWRVDIFDVVLGASAYQAVPGDYHWNPRCDIAEPYDIIDIFDIVMICQSYGEEYTP